MVISWQGASSSALKEWRKDELNEFTGISEAEWEGARLGSKQYQKICHQKIELKYEVELKTILFSPLRIIQDHSGS